MTQDGVAHILGQHLVALVLGNEELVVARVPVAYIRGQARGLVPPVEDLAYLIPVLGDHLDRRAGSHEGATATSPSEASPVAELEEPVEVFLLLQGLYHFLLVREWQRGIRISYLLLQGRHYCPEAATSALEGVVSQVTQLPHVLDIQLDVGPGELGSFLGLSGGQSQGGDHATHGQNSHSFKEVPPPNIYQAKTP